MDLLLSLFFRLFIYTIGILFVIIIVVRLTKPASVRLLLKLEELSANKLFQKIFLVAGVLIFVFIAIFVLPSDPLSAIAAGIIGGTVYLFILFSIMRLLHGYLKEEE